MNEKKFDENIPIIVADGTWIGDTFYFIALELNLIISMDLNTGKIEIVSAVPEEGADAYSASGCIIAYANELYLGPYKTKNIWVYNLATETWKEIEKEDYKFSKESTLNQNFVYHDTIYFLGGGYGAIVKIDPISKKTEYITKPFDSIHLRKDDVYFRCQHVLKDDILYVPSCLSNLILEFNLLTEEFNWVEVGGKNNRYSGITFDGNDFWLSPRHGTPIVRWDGNNKTEEISSPFESDSQQHWPLGCLCDEGQISIYDSTRNGSFSLRKKDYIISTFDNSYLSVREFDDGLVDFAQDTQGYLDIHLRDQKEIRVKPEVPLQDVQKLFLSMNFSPIEIKEETIEGRVFTLKNLLAQLQCSK